MNILFVCRGNVGRSQMAEGLMKRLVGNLHEISSAGTKLSGPSQRLEELPLAENLIECMKEVGIDVSKSFRKEITPEMAEKADMIILVVDVDDPVPEYLASGSRTVRWTVNDPKGKDLDFHRKVRDQISDLVNGLSKVIS